MNRTRLEAFSVAVIAIIIMITGPILWVDLHLLFCLSLIPFTTGWVGENHFAELPTALYGFVLLIAAIAYFILLGRIIASQGSDSLLRRAIGKDWKGKLSPVLYVVAILVALMWLVPDRRIERVLARKEA